MKRLFLLLGFIMLVACSNPATSSEDTNKKTETAKVEKYSRDFFDTFDTIVSFISYDDSQEEFNKKADFVEEEFHRLHKLYDNYNNYEGINNIKTVNDNAGKGPVKVDKDLIDLVIFSKRLNKEVSPKVNVAMGSVLNIWHDYREKEIEDKEISTLPPMEELEIANENCNIDDIIIDEEKSTIEITNPNLLIDLGATAKGYATELVCNKLEEKGVTSAMLSAGGNVKVIGNPKDGRESWVIGIQNPENAFGRSDEQIVKAINVKDASVVTSGNYQRYYIVDGNNYHHLIDPDTLMPGNYYSSVSIIAEDSGFADFLSTAAFLLPFEESKKLVEDNNAEAVWVMPDKSIVTTNGIE